MSEITKRRSRGELQLKRSLLTREYVLHLNRNLCDGCGVCAENCPKEAIKWNSAQVTKGRLTRKPSIDFDISTCILCGECATVCPLDAIRMTIDGQEIATIVKNEAFPILLKEIKVDTEKCKSECQYVCQTECPTKAITVSSKSFDGKKGKSPLTVRIDESACIYCRRCELACPFEAIQVKKPFQGTVQINANLCPRGCRACVDICPAHALQVDGGKPSLSGQFCVYCFACQKVCPEQNINVKREWIFHSDVRSAAWLTALKKLTSIETVAKEVTRDSGWRRVSAVESRESTSKEET